MAVRSDRIPNPEPMRQRQALEFPYKHSTGEVIGRFLAGLKLDKKIWGRRVSGQGVVVPPLDYSEADGSGGGADETFGCAADPFLGAWADAIPSMARSVLRARAVLCASGAGN